VSEEVSQGDLWTLTNSEGLNKSRRSIEQSHLSPGYESHHEGRSAYNLGERSEIEDGRKVEGNAFGGSLQGDLISTTDLGREPSMLRSRYQSATNDALGNSLVEDLGDAGSSATPPAIAAGGLGMCR